jgi:hypothetical protein
MWIEINPTVCLYTKADVSSASGFWLYVQPSIQYILLVLSHMFGYGEQKLLGRSRKSLVFLESNFFGSEKFQVSAHVLLK